MIKSYTLTHILHILAGVKATEDLKLYSSISILNCPGLVPAPAV